MVVSNIVFFTRKLGEDSHFDEHIFQWGWFNYQVALAFAFMYILDVYVLIHMLMYLQCTVGTCSSKYVCVDANVVYADVHVNVFEYVN